MIKNGFFIFTLVSLFFTIKCYCEGSHNRKDLNKKECARYEIEPEEVNGDEVENYQCCFIYYLMLDNIMEKECYVDTKKKGEKFLEDLAFNSHLNIFGATIECSFRYLLSFNNVIKIIILNLML